MKKLVEFIDLLLNISFFAALVCIALFILMLVYAFLWKILVFGLLFIAIFIIEQLNYENRRFRSPESHRRMDWSRR